MRIALYFFILFNSTLFAQEQLLLDFTEDLLSDLNFDKIERFECPDLKKWRPTKCVELSEEMREAIIEASTPDNFPNTRYRKSYSLGKSIEQETDCSRFVFHIFQRAGLYYPMATTKNFNCLSVFKEINEENARAGDVVLTRGHIGILSRDGKLISATSGKRSRWRGSSIRELSLKSFRGRKRFYSWTCPESELSLL
jgi:hypothetical protein